MKRNIAILSLVTGLVLGSTLLRDNLPTSTVQAQSAPQISLNEGQARLQNEQNTMDIVKNYQDGVVYVGVYAQPEENALSGSPFGGNMDPFEYFFGNPQQTPQPRNQNNEPEQSGVGSGFLLDKDGYILTNYHVVADSSKIRVRLHRSDKEYDATVVGKAPDYDLALLKVDNLDQNLAVPMKLGNSDNLAVGQKAIAMGAPFDLDFTVTEGIISNVGRVIPTGQRGIPQKAIQTDAAINPGNSGGPLLNSSGEVIGINTQILSPSGGQNAGIGFAIPINVAKNILPQLKAGKTVSGPRIGISGLPLAGYPLNQLRQDLIDQYKLPKQGVLVQEVTKGSPADKAGIKAGTRSFRTGIPQVPTIVLGGDVITTVNGKKVESSLDIANELFSKQNGDKVQLGVLRDGKTINVDVTLSTFEDTQQ
ncbi:S1C family serine protease [Deinococcus cellulosilyticus]|uniref:Serine protease n=1 Tax=Deinococcus cellulosilyticus (strain DSM 18568 / NBRC 106333 / KACC 11606 / 5516J-15) TaxID=1223518 RepID=A0A511MY12_DEIC1|nr:trypsin-like peptidase domain-containing protein [Deinococcus cellulosilyticus]GEM45026.1 serine protease [Deinococcus cellulosilyticus NBRC 106333 = KACC 11606]